MQIPRQIFKMYDIRGLVQEEITPELAHAIGRGVASLISRESAGPLTVVVGRDMRESSQEYQAEVMKGLQRHGVRVLDIGLVSTPAYFYAVSHLKASGGIMVTASHNPIEYNGFKLTRAGSVVISGESGIQEIADTIEAEGFVPEAEGSIEVVEGIPAQAVAEECAAAGDETIAPMKIVADTANGMGAQYLDELFAKLDAEVVRMYWEFDGTFPNHEADPMKPENLAALQARVKEEGADLGIATDGDGDRIFFVSNDGEIVPPAFTLGLLAQEALRKNPGAKIGHDVRPQQIAIDLIQEAGGIPMRTRVGSSIIKEQMKREGSPFAGELTGHFFFDLEEGNFERPVLCALRIMQRLTREGKPFSGIIAPFHKYVHSGEINFVVDDKEAAIAQIKARYADAEQSELDGVSVTYPDFWFNVRASNTEPKLRLNLEAVSQEVMEARRDEISSLLTGDL